MDFANFDDYWIPLINGQGTLAAFLSSYPKAFQSGCRPLFAKPIYPINQTVHEVLQVPRGPSKELCQRDKVCRRSESGDNEIHDYR